MTFRKLDNDFDGVLSAAEFKQCYHILCRQETDNGNNNKLKSPSLLSIVNNELREDEMKTFLSLIKLLDPLETDRIIYSSAVACINKINIETNNNN
jgi:hypothetical protein